MAAGLDPGSNSDPKDPYSLLGVNSGAGFDDVQKARDRVVASCGDDAVARARVEAAYDAVLMERLRDRQSGRLSSAAASASAAAAWASATAAWASALACAAASARFA